MKLLHVADVHLGASFSGFGELASRRSAEVLDAFRGLPEIAAAERVHAVLVAGDLFDGPQPGRETLAAVRETLRRLTEAGIHVFMVPGNHDSTTLRLDPYGELARGSGVRVHAGSAAPERAWPGPSGSTRPEEYAVHIFAGPRFGEPVQVETEEGPLHVYGAAFDAAECRDPLSTFRRGSGPGVHVALLHASVHEAHWRPSASSLTAAPAALAALDVDYIALGDHHRPRMPAELGGLPACYPGSFAACDLTETGPRGYALVRVGSGVEPRIEHHDAGVVPVVAVELDVSSFDDHVQVAEALGGILPPRAVPVVRLVGEPAFPIDIEAVSAELRARYGHASVTDESRFYASDRLDVLAELDTVAGHVVRLGRKRIAEAESDEARAVARGALRSALRALEVR